MRKPWEESGSHRDDFGFDDRARRSDRRLIAVTILSVAPIVVLIGVMKASAAPMMATVDVIAAVMTEREVLAVGATTFRVNILVYAQVPEPAQQWQAAAMSSGVKVSLAAMR